MGLQRSKLKELGLADDVIESVMSAYGSAINAYKSDLEASSQENAKLKGDLENIRKELADIAEKQKAFKVEETEQYKELFGRYTEMQNAEKLSNIGVNKKYTDIVKGKIDFNDFDNSVKRIKDDFPEFFDGGNTAQAKPPVFSADNQNQSENMTEEEKVLEQIKKAFES